MLGFVCVSLNLVQTDRQKGCHIIIVNHIWQSYWADMVKHVTPRVDEVSTDVWSTWVYVGGLKRMSGWFDLTVEKKERKKRNISETLQKVVLFQNFQWGPGSLQTSNFVYTAWKSYPTLTFKLMKHQCVRKNERVPSLVWQVRAVTWTASSCTPLEVHQTGVNGWGRCRPHSTSGMDHSSSFLSDSAVGEEHLSLSTHQ